jgi:hypothetical protein
MKRQLSAARRSITAAYMTTSTCLSSSRERKGLFMIHTVAARTQLKLHAYNAASRKQITMHTCITSPFVQGLPFEQFERVDERSNTSSAASRWDTISVTHEHDIAL